MKRQNTKTQHEGEDIADGSVLEDLHRAEEHYREIRERVEDQTETLAKTEHDLVEARSEITDLRSQLEAREEELRAAVEDAEWHRKRAQERAEAMRRIYRSVFNGNVYELILRASLALVDASRGIYVTALRPDGPLRVRAAIDVDGYPGPPSDRVEAIVRTVLDAEAEGDGPAHFLANRKGSTTSLPDTDRDGEKFDNCLAVPVVLLRNLNGIVIAFDKRNGEFDSRDAETVMSVGDDAAPAVENVHLRQRLQEAYAATVGILSDAMEAKDPYTQGHCEMVADLARRVANLLGLPPEDQAVVAYGALLHDTGKIGVSDGILNKPGDLLVEERTLVRSHVRIGHDLIARVPALKRVADVVLHHHESWDGTGYPDGLAGEDIPIAARIIAAVDAYSAMISKRSYKDAYSEEHARRELRRCAGSQFDPKVVEALLAALDGAGEEPFPYEEGWGLLPAFAQLGKDFKPL